MRDWLRSNSRRGRFAYLIALALPSFSLGSWLREPYPLYQLDAWAWIAVVPVCLVQLFRPTLGGWVLVVGTYSWFILLQVQQHIGAFEDMGSEDHSRWEGWGTELVLLGITAWLLLVLVLVLISPPKKLAHAT